MDVDERPRAARPGARRRSSRRSPRWGSDQLESSRLGLRLPDGGAGRVPRAAARAARRVRRPPGRPGRPRGRSTSGCTRRPEALHPAHDCERARHRAGPTGNSVPPDRRRASWETMTTRTDSRPATTAPRPPAADGAPPRGRRPTGLGRAGRLHRLLRPRGAQRAAPGRRAVHRARRRHRGRVPAAAAGAGRARRGLDRGHGGRRRPLAGRAGRAWPRPPAPWSSRR